MMQVDIDDPVRVLTDEGDAVILPNGHAEKIATLLLAAHEVARDATTAEDQDTAQAFASLYVETMSLFENHFERVE